MRTTLSIPVLVIPETAPFRRAVGYCGIDSDGDQWLARYGYGRWGRLRFCEKVLRPGERLRWGERTLESLRFAEVLLYNVLQEILVVGMLARRFQQQVIAKLSKRRFVLSEKFIVRWCAITLYVDGATLRFKANGKAEIV